MCACSEIYTALKAYAGTVEINIVGLAASAASVIAQAGHSRISPTALFMVHNVSGSAAGDFHDMQQEAEILQTANKAVAAAYLEKTGKSMEELLGIMDAETWMDAQKAVEYGFVDEVMFASAPTLTNGIGVLPAQTIHKLKDLLPARGEENAEVKTVTAKLKLLRLKGEMKDEV